MNCRTSVEATGLRLKRVKCAADEKLNTLALEQTNAKAARAANAA